MGSKSEIKSPLPLNKDIDRQVNPKISWVTEDYVSLPSSVEASTALSQEALGYAPQRRSRDLILLVTTCSIAAIILFLSAAFVSYSSDLQQSGGGLIEDNANADGEDEFYRASHTGFHFQPAKNWMNDPNAPMFYMGYYHLFYQYNPLGAVWEHLIAWGHAVSTDLIHWMYLDLAFMPDQWYDLQGVWSGSATILQDGTPAILYTGLRTAAAGDLAQSQNLALPVDPFDPLLRKWKKADSNPILVNPENILSQDFRDPTTAWLEKDGLWRFIVGAKRDNADGRRDGIALLYKSNDFHHWELEEKFLYEVNDTGMWECVDFYPVWVQGKTGLNHSALRAETYVETFKYVMKASLYDMAHDYYAIGTYSLENHTFIVDDPSLDVGNGPRYDYGKFYASKTFYDTSTGRRILWGWANESDSKQDDITKGWASVQTIPRTVWLDGTTSKNLLQWPVEEVETLREAKASHQNINLHPTTVLKVQGGDGSQLDIVVNFEKPDVDSVDGVNLESVEFECSRGSAHRGVFGPFGILVRADNALTEHTGIFFYISPLKDGQWATWVCSDQSRSSLAPGLDKTVYGSYITVLRSENVLSLRVLVDHSIVETFFQGGRLVITSRVYPTVALGSKSHLFLFNNGTTIIRVKSLDVYKMTSVNMTTI